MSSLWHSGLEKGEWSECLRMASAYANLARTWAVASPSWLANFWDLVRTCVGVCASKRCVRARAQQQHQQQRQQQQEQTHQQHQQHWQDYHHYPLSQNELCAVERWPFFQDGADTKSNISLQTGVFEGTLGWFGKTTGKPLWLGPNPYFRAYPKTSHLAW